MADEAKNAPAGEPKKTETPAATEGAKPEGESGTPAKPEGTNPEAKADTTTVAEALGDAAKVETDGKPEGGKPKDEPRMVPEAVVIELKKDLKELKRQLAQGNPSVEEVDDALEAIGKEHNVDATFLQKLAGAIRTKTQAEFNEKLEKELAPYKAQSSADREAKFDKVFNEHYEKALDAMPEFKDIANKEVIKALVRDPKNANKTFQKIIEDAYGNALQGKPSLDGGKPGGGKDITEIDFERAQKDSDYYAQIMASPSLKAKYNEELPKRLKL